MKNFLKDYLSFSVSERKGIVILLIILFLLIFIWKLLPHLKVEEFVNTKEFEKDINDFEKSISKKEAIKNNLIDSNILNKYFLFNPNNLSDSNWYNLGLSDKQIVTIRNFQEKGGKFKTKEDLKKMYCLKPGQYELLEPFIALPDNDNTQTDFQKKDKIKLQEFDPNCTSHKEWQEFGLSEKQITVIENYISRGGKFKTKDDFKKMYCILPQLYDQLEPYISIAQEPVTLPEYDPDIRIDFNKADSAGFRKIKRINSYLARNIVKYRNTLGGFVNKKQILEVWGFNNEIYNSIEKNILISEISVKKINLNTATFAELLKHPYLNYDFTKAIIQYKRIVGKIKTTQELIKNNIVPDTTIYKIKPYLLTE